LCAQLAAGIDCYEAINSDSAPAPKVISQTPDFIGTADVIVGDYNNDGVDDVSCLINQ